MGSLFKFLYKYRAFQLFLILELICTWLIVQNNSYQGVAYLNSSNRVVAYFMAISNSINDYFYLQDINRDLAEENARLNFLLSRNRLSERYAKMDTMRNAALFQYDYKVAKVINNSVSFADNYLTINKGLADGIKPGMGVVSPTGVVGRVKICSEHFSTITSLLHTKMLISAEITRSHAFGTVKWDGKDPFEAKLMYIARHIKPIVGDTIVTSEFSTIFPSGQPVGIIRKINIRDDDTFYNIDLELFTDFSTLSYVYVIQNRLKAEQDSIQNLTAPNMNQQ
ncbi:rod shape-determining protein MreC [Flexibacter flexilis DSM 6793]|uniref:Cell shape-determining protein MreC n=1 Tax=Flexibacter flexilis DSM 6793 TaxID=927664 RepID=A0A1I1KSI8_9BACT|nr:rod shape-determining protein MreC [Flexibacter flexilis]SFC61113.1 rod shape-determining protein MreC [Flexibacter flexilis DSM 6793]